MRNGRQLAAVLLAAGFAVAGSAHAQTAGETFFRAMFELKVHAMVCTGFVRGHADAYPSQIDDYWRKIGGSKQSDPQASVDEMRRSLQKEPNEVAHDTCAKLLTSSVSSYQREWERFIKANPNFPVPPIFVGYIW